MSWDFRGKDYKWSEDSDPLHRIADRCAAIEKLMAEFEATTRTPEAKTLAEAVKLLAKECRRLAEYKA